MKLLAAGVTQSDQMREHLARHFYLTDGERADMLESRVPKFVNNHAWALVRLQHERLIEKVSQGKYSLTEKGFRALEEPSIGANQYIDAPSGERTPKWARALINRANARNPAGVPRFMELDLLELWRRCDGRCAVTRLPFSDEKVGTGKAKRAFAPSLDRIDPEQPYTRDNCRLVMVAVNFGMNAWGLEVYLKLAQAAVETAQSTD